MLPGPGSCPGWKGLGFGTEGASGSRFLPREEGLKKQKKLTFLGMLFLGNQKKQHGFAFFDPEQKKEKNQKKHFFAKIE